MNEDKETAGSSGINSKVMCIVKIAVCLEITWFIKAQQDIYMYRVCKFY